MTRVEQPTDQAINEQIKRRTEQRLVAAGRQGDDDIDRRLEEPALHTVDEGKAK